MRKKKIFIRLILCGMALSTLPLFCVSLKGRFPAPREAILITAENAAELAFAHIYNESDPESDTAAFIPADSAESAVPKSEQHRLKITSDDSGMLSESVNRYMPSSDDEEGFIDEPPGYSETPDGDEPYDSDPFDGAELDGIVSEVTFGVMNGTNYINLSGGGQIRNLTDIENSDIEGIINSAGSFALKADGTPEVLIYHTHATEAFLPDGVYDRYNTDFPFRSTDKSINMVSVGNAIEKELEAAGIGVIHDETLYDEESYNGSYDKSRAGISAILRDNPGIKLVLDVHRDAIVRSDSEIVSAVAEIGGRKAAQIMIISNCDGVNLKYPIPNYRENLKAAVSLDEVLNKYYPGLSRAIMFDYRQYNQDLSPGSLLIEIGSHGNTHAEAVYSGELIGKAIAKLARK
jgi:stage II sporulation protein P